MIAKIGRGNNLHGALAYNQLKVENENGKILFMNKMIETKDGKYTVTQLTKSFEPYLMANKNTEKATLHISLNPDPKDQVSDEKFVQIAQDYMNEMGYSEQPFVVFKHTDINRTHIHIVSIGVDEEGRKISDKFEKRKSMKICRNIEKKYQLLSATDKEFAQNEQIFSPVDYHSGDVKSQLASVIRNIANYYHFQTIGEYNAVLSIFNITSEKVEKVDGGVVKNGLVYFALNEKGDKISHPFKSSLFGKVAGLDALNDHFLKSKEIQKASSVNETLKAALLLVMKSKPGEIEFKKKLKEMGINTVVRRNATGRIYGVTFIDHQSKSVWNGSRLGKEFSANSFNQYWSVDNNSNKQRNDESRNDVYLNNFEVVQSKQPHELFNFLQDYSTNIIAEFGSILPESLGEDFDELDFENRIKKKRKLRKPKS
ncbi:relaxase/mobilization nuclease domain-containing protein [Chryseobacterium sp. C-39]|uniref:Relaxase/mobilization nuclease domain-containing protein n=1 Tax=Chryseobacterium muglaense TaxID=2893752 RepID=A0A9Q3YRN9_9FLAO|nr:conjugal transfer protein MobB [Chryseobacterium muglaense]MBD3906070.1 relaxase/mobilization nuclease domain-containing protein [Chryseobacterium muglaense]MCC9032992.1 relaxase/mobilization nuclease domain-containing protein [Chryseobacterium muglaense]